MRLRSPMSCVPFTPRVLAAAAHTDGSVDPIDIPKLAKMAQVQVSEQEVGATRCAMLACSTRGSSSSSSGGSSSSSSRGTECLAALTAYAGILQR
jgi:hypothetical protein